MTMNSHDYNGGKEGECYFAAFVFMLRHGGTIVHGAAMVDNVDSPAAGRKVLHAWVEGKIKGEIVVFDASNPHGPVAMMRRADYYRRHDVNPNKLRKYNEGRAKYFGDKTGHVGPWQRPMEPECGWTEADERKMENGIFMGHLDEMKKDISTEGLV